MNSNYDKVSILSHTDGLKDNIHIFTTYKWLYPQNNLQFRSLEASVLFLSINNFEI